MLHADHIAPGSAEYKQSLADILSIARHLPSLINNVPDLAKVESGKMEFVPEPIDPAVAAQKNIRIDAEVAPDLGGVVLDSGKLRQVLYNYLSNAIKFSGDGAHITIRMRPEAEAWLRLEVENSGEGIRAEDLPRLFTEFHQTRFLLQQTASGHWPRPGADAADRRGAGGTVGVSSEYSKGSIFWVLLPRRYPAGNDRSGSQTDIRPH